MRRRSRRRKREEEEEEMKGWWREEEHRERESGGRGHTHTQSRGGPASIESVCVCVDIWRQCMEDDERIAVRAHVYQFLGKVL